MGVCLVGNSEFIPQQLGLGDFKTTHMTPDGKHHQFVVEAKSTTTVNPWKIPFEQPLLYHKLEQAARENALQNPAFSADYVDELTYFYLLGCYRSTKTEEISRPKHKGRKETKRIYTMPDTEMADIAGHVIKNCTDIFIVDLSFMLLLLDAIPYTTHRDKRASAQLKPQFLREIIAELESEKIKETAYRAMYQRYKAKRRVDHLQRALVFNSMGINPLDVIIETISFVPENRGAKEALTQATFGGVQADHLRRITFVGLDENVIKSIHKRVQERCLRGRDLSEDCLKEQSVIRAKLEALGLLRR